MRKKVGWWEPTQLVSFSRRGPRVARSSDSFFFWFERKSRLLCEKSRFLNLHNLFRINCLPTGCGVWKAVCTFSYCLWLNLFWPGGLLSNFIQFKTINSLRKGHFPGGAVVKNPPANAGTRVRALAREDPTCRGATKPMHHNYWACALEPVSHNYWACAPRAHAPQQEKPLQWEARTPQRRVAPAHRN